MSVRRTAVRAPPEPPSGPTGVAEARNPALDALKGVAIIGVLAQHAVTAADLRGLLSAFHLGLAVPVFVFLTGLNLSRSSWARGRVPFRGLYPRRYLTRRAGRLLPPLAAAWLLALLVGLVLDRLRWTPQILFGSFPMPGPGNYYVPVLLQVVVLTPLVAWAMFRRPGATLLACFAIDAVFWVVATQVGPVTRLLAEGGGFRFDAIGLRYLGVLALGVWVAPDPSRLSWRHPALWLVALLSLAYLLVERQNAGIWLDTGPGFERRTNFATAGLVWFWVVIGLAGLRRAWGAVRAPLAVLGAASYHIYLLQIVYFGVFRTESWGAFAISVIACSVLGVAFSRLVPGTSPLKAEQRQPVTMA